MKKTMLLAGLGLLPCLLQAQTSRSVRIGLTAGGTLTTRVGHGIGEEPQQQALLGVVGGVVAQVPLTANGQLFLQPEVVYNQEGYKLSHPSTNYSATLRSSYVSLPILLGFTTHGFFVTAGPQLGYLVGVNERYQFQNYTAAGVPSGQGENVNTDLQNYRHWEASLAAAVGYRFRTGFGLELRYTEALNSARINGSSVFDSNSQPRNAGGQLRLSYVLHKAG